MVIRVGFQIKINPDYPVADPELINSKMEEQDAVMFAKIQEYILASKSIVSIGYWDYSKTWDCAENDFAKNGHENFTRAAEVHKCEI